MSWFENVLDAVQTAAVIGDRVERLGGSVAEMAVELREVDRRVARLEGALEQYPISLNRPGSN